MKKNAKYLVLGGTLICVSLALLVVAAATTSKDDCKTCASTNTIPELRDNRGFVTVG